MFDVGVSPLVQWVKNPTAAAQVTLEVWVRSLPLLSGLGIWCCRELWCRLAAVALIGPLVWEFPYASGVALKSRKEKKSKRK